MPLDDVVKFLGAVGIGSAAIAWLLRTFFTHLLSRDIEQFTARLRAQHDNEVEKFKNDLQLAAFEHQTRFAKLHEERARIIAELYRKLHKANAAFEDLVAPLKVVGPAGLKPFIDEAGQCGREFFDYFHENRIYLDRELCSQIDDLNAVFHKTWSEFIPGGCEDYMAKGTEHLKIWTEFRMKVPPLRQEIEDRFRKLLGVH